MTEVHRPMKCMLICLYILLMMRCLLPRAEADNFFTVKPLVLQVSVLAFMRPVTVCQPIVIKTKGSVAVVPEVKRLF